MIKILQLEKTLWATADKLRNNMGVAEYKHVVPSYPAYHQNVTGSCKNATTQEIRKNIHILTPGRYVGFAEEEDDGIPFGDKMQQLTAELGEQFKASQELEQQIRENLKGIGFEVAEN